MILKKCLNDTQNPEDCGEWESGDIIGLLEREEYLEAVAWNGFRMWHLIFLSLAALLSLIILLCCCVKFRIPRTKQEIEADYIRRNILRKFRKRLKLIQNQELDEMDLKKALDKIRAEFKSDTESLAQSEAGFSAATLSSTGLAGVGAQGSTYRRASQIQIDISLEELRAHSMGLRARLSLALSRLFGRSKVAQSDKVALTVAPDGETQLMVPKETSAKKLPSSEDKSKEKKTSKSDKKKPEKSKEEKGGKATGSGTDKTGKGEGQSAPGQPTTSTATVGKNPEKKDKDKKKSGKEKEEKVKVKIENEKGKNEEKPKEKKKEKTKEENKTK